MPRVKKLDLGMTALDELFMNDKERAENKLPKIFDIPLSEIDDFPDHPYRVLDDEDMVFKRFSKRNQFVSRRNIFCQYSVMDEWYYCTKRRYYPSFESL